MTMASKPRVSGLFLTLTLSFCLTVSLGKVHEINQGSIDKFLRGKLFVLTFVDSPTCTRCRILFPFYLAASQVFPNDPEIFFTRTHDKSLIQKWGITELPALVYHRMDIKSFEIMNVDVTVDDIVEEIARILYGNFGGLTRTYTVHADEQIYDEVIMTPKQSVLLLLYKKDDYEAVRVFENVAKAFRKDDAILLATLDVEKHQKLRDKKFLSRDTPVVIWLDAEDKNSPKRFGGVLSEESLSIFINERTGLHRSYDGALLEEAGRVEEADKIIENNIEKIIEATPENLKEVADQLRSLQGQLTVYETSMIDYYLFVLTNIAQAGNTDIVRELIYNVEATLYGGEDTKTKAEESLKRQKNVYLFFRQAERDFKDEQKKKEKAEKKAKEQKMKEVVLEQPAKHTHIHTEL
ncbi:uncharacterized protein LOC131935415 [Physella acuta]|uniref:uncharacterized protein LOC131935415 n=1 Tax=Physella acuta TaxID=109671 RepID=UPI0027DD78C6|nr:uncharacterized protein LOC131935415 [Physella acuta]